MVVSIDSIGLSENSLREGGRAVAVVVDEILCRFRDRFCDFEDDEPRVWDDAA